MENKIFNSIRIASIMHHLRLHAILKCEFIIFLFNLFWRKSTTNYYNTKNSLLQKIQELAQRLRNHPPELTHALMLKVSFIYNHILLVYNYYNYIVVSISPKIIIVYFSSCYNIFSPCQIQLLKITTRAKINPDITREITE